MVCTWGRINNLAFFYCKSRWSGAKNAVPVLRQEGLKAACASNKGRKGFVSWRLKLFGICCC
jgi:hypothetical protein